MSFITGLALLVALLVGAPVAAHLLRRRQAEEKDFPPARLVPATPPSARRRSMLEDRALFAIRAVAVVTLALLGATPFVRCSRLALSRNGGASVALAIVVDDSLSMRAPLGGGPAKPGATTRFRRALRGAKELTQGLASGDAVAVVLAGAPARVALASTTNMAAVAAAIDGLEPSDRATDLDTAIRLARDLLKGLPQPDRRVVLLSDLADGTPDQAPIATEGDIATWIPLSELESSGADCAVTRADRAGVRVRAHVVCTASGADGDEHASENHTAARDAADASAGAPAPSAPRPRGTSSASTPPAPPGPSAGRVLEIRADAAVLASVPLGPHVHSEEVSVDIPHDAPGRWRAVLTGADSIAEDDAAPVVTAGGALPIAIVVDATTRVATGGPPPIEQAFAALELDAQIRPLPTVPEHPDELSALSGIIVDDAPGFTPEMRRSLSAWVERGGTLLLTLGPHAAAAPLGAGFDPLVPGLVRWAPAPSSGIDAKAAVTFGPSAEGFEKLDPRGRAWLDPAAEAGSDVLARWQDGAPFLVRRSRGRGAILALTLPFSTDESDLALRPAFLTLLERFVDTARARGGARRIDVGETWTFDGFKRITIQHFAISGSDKPTPIPVTFDDGRPRATPPLAGLYELNLDGEASSRIAAVPEREIELRPRRVLESARSASLGGVQSSLDASPYVALALLGLVAIELLLRALSQRSASG
jgi:hypothetical protein